MNSDARTGFLTIGGTINARDLGGLKTNDGRCVRRGVLIRSAELDKLTDQGVIALRDQHRVGTILDLRSTRERMRRPLAAAAQFSGARLAYSDYQSGNADMELLRTKGDVTRAEVHAMMLDIYRRLPWEQADSFRLLFELVEAKKLPMLFHCAAGKDRTGVAAALVLSALGVTRAAIYDDFLMSERYFGSNRARFAGNGADALLLRPEWEPILRTDRAYLEVMFAALDKRGGVDAYFTCALGFDEPRIERLRECVLEAL